MNHQPIYFSSEICSPLTAEEAARISNNQSIYIINPFTQFLDSYHTKNQKMLERIKKNEKKLSKAFSKQKDFNSYVEKCLHHQDSLNHSLCDRLKDCELSHQIFQEKLSNQETDTHELQDLLRKQKDFIEGLKKQINNQEIENHDILVRLYQLEALQQKLPDLFAEHENTMNKGQEAFQEALLNQLDERDKETIQQFNILTDELQYQLQFYKELEDDINDLMEKQNEFADRLDTQSETNIGLLNKLESEHQYNEDVHSQIEEREAYLADAIEKMKEKLESEDSFGNLLKLGDRIQVFSGNISATGVFIKMNLPFLYWIEDTSNRLWITNTKAITISKL